MALHKRTIKNGSIQIDGRTIDVQVDDGIRTVWIRAWRRLNGQSMPELTFHEKDGKIPLYFDDGHTIAIVGNGVKREEEAPAPRRTRPGYQQRQYKRREY
jgi:hypothetical protein